MTSIAIGSTTECSVTRPRGTGLLSLVVAVRGLFDHPLATVEAVRRDPMAQVCLTRLWIDRQRRFGQRVVRAVHATPGRRLAAFLNGHCDLLTGRCPLAAS